MATVVSAISWYSLLQMLFFRPIYLHLSLFMTCRCFSACLSCINCIYILPFLGFEDTSFANFSSASHVFYDLRILLIEIVHPLRALSILCGYSSSKFCIFNPRKSPIADIVAQYPLRSIYFMDWADTWLTKNWYKKFERIWNERWRHLERKFLR